MRTVTVRHGDLIHTNPAAFMAHTTLVQQVRQLAQYAPFVASLANTTHYLDSKLLAGLGAIQQAMKQCALELGIVQVSIERHNMLAQQGTPRLLSVLGENYFFLEQDTEHGWVVLHQVGESQPKIHMCYTTYTAAVESFNRICSSAFYTLPALPTWEDIFTPPGIQRKWEVFAGYPKHYKLVGAPLVVKSVDYAKEFVYA